MIGSALLGAVMITTLFTLGASANEPNVTHQVVIEKFKFAPATMTVKAGDTVEWINRDIVPHTATEDKGAWDTKNLNKGQAGVITFSSPGEQSYICRFHPNMKGKITITE